MLKSGSCERSGREIRAYIVTTKMKHLLNSSGTSHSWEIELAKKERAEYPRREISSLGTSLKASFIWDMGESKEFLAQDRD